MADITYLNRGKPITAAFCGNAAVAQSITPADEYIDTGLALVRLKPNTKDATQPGWQLSGHGVTNGDAVGASFGLHHLDSGTCALDFDNYADASAWLDENGIDAQALLLDDDAVQIRSGRANRAKLLYRLPESVDYLPTHKLPCGLELRCANRDGTSSAQDVLPPSIHPDTGKPYEWLGDWRTLPVLPDDVLHVWLSLDDAKPAEKVAQDTTGTFTKGHRDDALTALAGTMQSYGFSEQAIYAALHEENARRCVPPKSDKAIRRIAHSASRYEPNTDVAASTVAGKQAAEALLSPDRFTLHRMNDFNPPPMEWRVKHVLPATGLAQIFGPSRSGKSFLAFDMACAIAEGREWFGFRVKQAPVVYIWLEGQSGYTNRRDAWLKHHQRSRLPDEMFIMVDHFKLTKADVQALAPKLPDGAVIYIDTQARATAGDENSAQDMGELIARATDLHRACNGTTILVHHTGHGDTSRGRGSSAQIGAVDTSIGVQRKPDDTRTWTSDKVKDSADNQNFGFRLEVVKLGTDEDGDDITSCVVAQEAISENKAESEISKYRRWIDNAWFASGCDELDGKPYLTKQAFLRYLIRNCDVKASTAERYVRPSGKLVGELLATSIIEAERDGWIVVNEAFSASLLTRKNEAKNHA